MPVLSSRPDSSRVIVALAIAGAHVGAIYGLTQIRAREPSAANAAPVAVRFIAESSPRADWQPPKVNPLVPIVSTTLPDLPSIETPLPASESSRAISVPLMTAVPASPEQRPSELARLVAAVEYLREPAPRYPAQSRKLREQGLVVLRVLIDERGAACDVVIENSSGHERLDRAAREAIARAEFRPYVEDGVARRALVLIPIEFSLNRGPARVASANGA